MKYKITTKLCSFEGMDFFRLQSREIRIWRVNICQEFNGRTLWLNCFQNDSTFWSLRRLVLWTHGFGFVLNLLTEVLTPEIIKMPMTTFEWIWGIFGHWFQCKNAQLFEATDQSKWPLTFKGSVALPVDTFIVVCSIHLSNVSRRELIFPDNNCRILAPIAQISVYTSNIFFAAPKGFFP